MDRRLAIIRCVLFTTLGVALFGWGWLVAGLSVFIVGLMMPAFASTPSHPLGCGVCSDTAPASVQADFSGWGPNLPGCDAADCAPWHSTSFVLPAAAACCYEQSGNTPICGVGFCLRFCIGQGGLFDSFKNYLVENQGSCGVTSGYFWKGAGGSPQTCGGTFPALTYDSTGAGFGTLCDGTGSSATVTAL